VLRCAASKCWCRKEASANSALARSFWLFDSPKQQQQQQQQQQQNL
jgi:hypothetical protein